MQTNLNRLRPCWQQTAFLFATTLAVLAPTRFERAQAASPAAASTQPTGAISGRI